MNFKNAFIGLFLAGFIFSGSIVFAIAPANMGAGKIKDSNKVENSGAIKAVENQQEKQAKFCEKLASLSDNFSKKVIEKQKKIQERNQERFENLKKRQNENDAALANFRKMKDENFQAYFENLEKIAKTATQKKAVTDFEEIITKAMETRRDIIDSAIEKFRSGVKEAIDSKKTGIESAVQVFSDSQIEAFSKAKTDCGNGVDPKTVRTTLHASLKSARESFKSSQQDIEKIGAKVTELAKVRNQEMEKAKNDFQLIMEEAKIELKKSFPTE